MEKDYFIQKYFDVFGEMPQYIPTMASLNDDIFTYLMIEAIERGKPLTDEEIDNAYKDKIDVVKEQENNQEGEDTEMDANKIRTLLKRYGAEDTEIENFMEDLENLKDEIEEDDDFNYLDNDTMEKLKATEEGKDLIMNAPKMAKEELKVAIKKYLSNAQ